MIVVYFSFNFDVVVQEGKLVLPMLPFWPEVNNKILFLLKENKKQNAIRDTMCVSFIKSLAVL